MTWMSFRAQRRIKVAHRLSQWAQKAERQGRLERAAQLREAAAHHSRVAYTIEEVFRKYVIPPQAGAA